MYHNDDSDINDIQNDGLEKNDKSLEMPRRSLRTIWKTSEAQEI